MIHCLEEFIMTMMRKTITIPDAMEQWVKAQVNSGRYGNDSEYFRDLIRRDQDRRTVEHELRALIDEGLNSGISDKNAEDIRQGVLKRLRENGQLPT
jgi:antitoxin ParD1/3/4